MPYSNKTGRKRGAVLRVIRAIAHKHKNFTIENLSPPLDMMQAHRSLCNMVKHGELKRLKVATFMGNWVKRAVYCKTDLLRTPEQTNMIYERNGTSYRTRI